MFKYLKEYRFYIVLFFFIIIPIVAIDTATHTPRPYRFYDRVAVGITAPVQRLIAWSLDLVVSAFNNYVYLWQTRQTNLRLLEENRKLLNLIVNLREAQDENVRLRKLLDFKEEFNLQTIAARVIAKDVSTEFRAIRINRGEEDGIRKDMAVINNEGIVGRILRTAKKTSDVVTILDLLSAVDAIDKRSRVRGIVEGMTDQLCQLKFALRTDDILANDLLISSGLGGVFPKGIPVGVVSKVKKEAYGITQTVEVRPSVDFSRLEEVLVVADSQAVPFHLTAPQEVVSRIGEAASATAAATNLGTPASGSNPQKEL